MPAASTVVQGAMRRRTSTHKPVQLTRADITTAEVELAGERAQELIALLYRNRGGQLHDGTELFIGQGNHCGSAERRPARTAARRGIIIKDSGNQSVGGDAPNRS